MERLSSIITSSFKTFFMFLFFICQMASAETLTSDTTIIVGDYSYSEDLVVPSGVTLTVEAGAILRFSSGNKIQVQSGGKLFVTGTASESVTFTSDGQTPASWAGFDFEGARVDGNDIVINYAIIEYADKALYTNQAGTKATVSHSIVRHNNYGVYVDAYYQSAPNHPTITFKNGALYSNAQFNYYTNLFYGNDISVIDATGNWWGSNDPQVIATSINDLIDGSYKPSVDFSGYLDTENGNAIGTSYAGYIKGEVTWSATDGILAQPVRVGNGSTLTITAGSTFDAKTGAELIVDAGGKLFIQGTEAQPVTFTSSAETPNSWKGFRFEGARTDANDIIINHALVEYADKAFYTNQPSVKAIINHTTVRYNNYGVYVDAYYQSAPNHPVIAFTNGSLYENVEYNYFTNLFYGNDITVIDATGNWWGTNEPQTIGTTIVDLLDGSYKPSVNFSGYRESEFGTASGTSFAGYVKGDITWSASDGVLAQPVRVGNGSSLTITAGTQIEAKAGAELIVDAGGKLFIQGTNAEPVVFTSVLAVPDSWEGLKFEGNRTTANDIVLDNVIIEYADKALYTNQAGVKVTVTNSIVRHNNYGVYVDAYYQSAPNHPTITFKNGALYNNTQKNYFTNLFYGSEITVIDATGNWWGSNVPQTIGSTITDYLDGSYKPSVDFSGFRESEVGSAIGTSYAGYIKGDVTWNATDGVLAQPVRIGKDSTLTITAGAHIDAHIGSQLIVDDGGKLFVQGTQALPVTFTGLTKAANSWKGLSFEGARIDDSEIIIDHAIIEYADKALYSNKPAVKALVTNSTVRHNNYGIYLDAYYQSAPNHPIITFKDGALYNNANYNYYTNLFYGSAVTTIDATGNWWGTADLTQIQNSIWDISDGSYKPSINFAGILTSENGSPLPGTHLMGGISGEHRWQFSDGVVLADTSIKSGANVIVESGTHLEFLGGAKLIIEDGAKFSVVGEESNPVTFTSGNATKAAGDWGGIEVKSNTNVHISNAVIEYADKGIFFNGLKASGRVTNSTIENNNTGVHVSAAHQSLANHPTPVVTNNVIKNNANYNYYSELFGSASSRTLNAKGNYWGTTDTATIAQNIYDNADSGSSPIVDHGLARASELTTVTADAGLDTLGYGTVETELVGVGSSNVAITSYAWDQYLGNQVTLNNAASATANFTVADVQNDELMSFIFTVTDANDISATDKLNVIVKPFSEFNQAPVVDQSQEILVTGGDTVSVTLAASDGDNDPLTYAWQQVSGETITLTATNTDTLAFAAPSNAKNKVVSFKLTVTDGNYTIERTVVVAVKAPETTAGTYYYHNDHLGTPQVMTDTNATVVWQANYTPFGQADIVVETVTNNIRFPGQYYDQESGLHYNYFRDYDPELGRYIQSDPIGLAGGINTYGYVGGNPISRIDFLGLAACAPDDKDCIQKCLTKNYGDLYTAASALSPLSLPSFAASEVASHVEENARRAGNRKLNGGDYNSKQPRHSEYKTGRRIAKDVARLARFSAFMAVAGAGAAGFQLGALGYCNISCAMN